MLEKALWRDFVAVTASVAVLGLGVGSTLPLTALVLTARGQGPAVVGWMVAAVALGGVAGTLAAPAATARFGRRRVMLGCVVLAAASVVPLQFLSSLWGWAVLRILFGAGMAPLFVVGEAWINTLAGDAVRGRVIALYTTSFTFCQVLGPLLTNGLTHLPGSAFTISGAVFLLGLPGIALARDLPLKPRNAMADGKDSDASWVDILRGAPAIVLGAGLFAAFDNITLSFLPLFALDHGFSSARALTAVVIVLAGDTTLQFAAGWLADRYGRSRVHTIGGILMCVLLPLMPLLVGTPGLWEIYLYVLGGVAGSLYTLAMVASGARFNGVALLRASGLIAMTWNVASSAGAAATGIVMEKFGSAALTAVLWVMALAFLYALHAERRQRRRADGYRSTNL